MPSNDHPLSELASSELSVIDAALRGDAVAPEHADLAELALLLRDDRPRPHPSFAATLDRHVSERAAQPAPLTRAAALSPSARLRRRLAANGTRAAACAIAVVLIVTVAIALLGTGGSGHIRQSGPATGADFGPAIDNGVLTPRTPAVKAPANPAEGYGAAKPSAPVAASAAASGPQRAIERTATLRLGVPRRQVESVDQQVFSIVNSFRGYVQQSSATSGSEQEGSASFQLRVPSASLSSTLAAISQLGRVLSETNTTSDVTEQLSSLTRSLGDARAERAGLLSQIKASADPRRAAALRAELAAVEGRISHLQASLASLAAQVDFTPISLTLAGEAPGHASSGANLTPGGAVRDAGEILSTALAVLLIAAAATLPVAIALLLGWSVLASTRRRQREQALDAQS